MGRPICFLLAIPLAWCVSPRLCAQQKRRRSWRWPLSGPTLFRTRCRSLHWAILWPPVWASFREGSFPFEKGSGSRGGELPPLAGAAFVRGKVAMLPGPGRATSAGTRLVFSMLIAVSGALVFTHSHSLGNIKEEVLAELSHITLAILAVMGASRAGWSFAFSGRIARALG